MSLCPRESIIERAQQLRREMSPPERLLLNSLSGQKADGLKFRRQHPMEPYVLDFYCAAAKLAVEVDGWAHSVGDQPQRDARRDTILAGQGIHTLRIPASDVFEDLGEVVVAIIAAARSRL